MFARPAAARPLHAVRTCSSLALASSLSQRRRFAASHPPCSRTSPLAPRARASTRWVRPEGARPRSSRRTSRTTAPTRRRRPAIHTSRTAAPTRGSPASDDSSQLLDEPRRRRRRRTWTSTLMIDRKRTASRTQNCARPRRQSTRRGGANAPASPFIVAVAVHDHATSRSRVGPRSRPVMTRDGSREPHVAFQRAARDRRRGALAAAAPRPV